jgi:hypothetical protein
MGCLLSPTTWTRPPRSPRRGPRPTSTKGSAARRRDLFGAGGSDGGGTYEVV